MALTTITWPVSLNAGMDHLKPFLINLALAMKADHIPALKPGLSTVISTNYSCEAVNSRQSNVGCEPSCICGIRAHARPYMDISIGSAMHAAILLRVRYSIETRCCYYGWPRR